MEKLLWVQNAIFVMLAKKLPDFMALRRGLP
jgi:hypothetical protein